MADTDVDEEVVVTIGDVKSDAGGAADDPAKVLAQQYKDLEADNAREKQRREHAEQRANQAQQDADRARRETSAAHVNVVESQYDTVATGLAAANAEATAGEQEYAAAFEKGDAAAMAKAQRKIANAEARAVRLDEARAELEVRRKEPARERQPERQQPRPTATDDPVEAYVANRTAPTQKWLRAHPEWITDPRKNAKLSAAHLDAVSEDLAADSKEYFDHVESFLGLRNQQQNGSGNGRDPAPQVKRKTSVPAAPVHQSSGGTNGGAREVRLTAGQARVAKDGTHVWAAHDLASGKIKDKSLIGQPIGIQEMARRVEIQTKQGLYDRTYTES